MHEFRALSAGCVPGLCVCCPFHGFEEQGLVLLALEPVLLATASSPRGH